MSLEETSKLLTESQKIFNESDDVSINTPVMLNMLLRIVSSIDGRLKSIETSVESVKNIRKDLLLMSSQVRELETSVADIVKSIHQQFPSEIEERRRKLYPIQKGAKHSGKHAVLVRDKLFIDGKQYILDESMEYMDMRSGNSRSDNPNSYRDSLLTTPKDMDRPYKSRRRSDSSPPMNDNGD
ncbi:unnamed protein product [Mytilus coruscus]|uniref:Uncharacterized protein n=1 Tax=Mytilus coruscus TaxID=42192 RepID=A0A6J8ER56_MYTCO|nr:unnamed protein product [Mytilus coruscus]